MKTEISLQEAMNIAGVVQKTIWNWCHDGKFKYRRAINRRLWIDKESFENYVKQLEESYNEKV